MATKVRDNICHRMGRKPTGDGWFYFEDGHAPMLNEFVLVFDGKEYSVQSFAEENLLSSKKLFQCWFPIVGPKFLKN